ncbi:WD and tetratricopeptide repeats protein 1 like protein [Argiope bruennichi]|uniref:WD and tetratricopeptide repeats protein 1 like protein n=1 Tax=Argiope bruennichi TaxID=94029 RepID=A0A8T0F4Y5_ARGBR|nr:WD and tetratricopeptide repeats protein 1 like protein [Argiope bruennichi]
MEYNNVLKLHAARQIDDGYRLRFQRKLHVTQNLVNRLGLEAELESAVTETAMYTGLLASGSDDLQILLWDPFLHKKLHSIPSGHHGNLFSVKFLPHSSDTTIVSGAADFRIRVHDVISKETTMSCSCHGGRVKRLAIAPNAPSMFWSAAEDGIVMQYDLRVPHQCSNICNNVLINLVYHLGRNAEAKCIAINPLRPELLAVGANDPYVRLYDRRMIKPTMAKYPREQSSGTPWENLSYLNDPVEPGDDNLPPGCVSYFVAGHLPLKQDDFKKRYRTLTSTYVAFSPDGNELLANLGGEQIYLFNILKKRKQLSFDMMDFSKPRDSSSSSSDSISSKKSSTNGIHSNGINVSCMYHEVPSYATAPVHKWPSPSAAAKFEKLKKRANEAFDKQEYTLAISLYSKGIIMFPDIACLYGNRAAAYIKRGWDGDHYAAIRDCYIAMKLDPDYLKAHFRLAQCLHKLRWVKEALECLTAIRLKFPEYAKTKSFESFETDVKVACFADMDIERVDTEMPCFPSIFWCMGKASNSVNKRRSSSVAKALLAISDQEKAWRASAYDYEARFCGHCNTTTDIKEANFFGSSGQFIVAGSDDGSIFIWDRITTNIVRVLRGDESIVNCLQPHPNTCLLATSGIDPVVRLWGPRPEDGSKEDRVICDSEDAAVANQRRMNADPLEIMLLNMGYRIPGVLEHISEEFEPRNGPDRNVVQCRTS